MQTKLSAERCSVYCAMIHHYQEKDVLLWTLGSVGTVDTKVLDCAKCGLKLLIPYMSDGCHEQASIF